MDIATPIKINRRFGQLENQSRGRIPYYQSLAPIRIFMDKIHHIAIQVESIAKSVDWYKENFDNYKIKYIYTQGSNILGG